MYSNFSFSAHQNPMRLLYVNLITETFNITEPSSLQYYFFDTIKTDNPKKSHVPKLMRKKKQSTKLKYLFFVPKSFQCE